MGSAKSEGTVGKILSSNDTAVQTLCQQHTVWIERCVVEHVLLCSGLKWLTT